MTHPYGNFFIVIAAAERLAYITAIFIVGEALELDPATKYVQKSDNYTVGGRIIVCEIKALHFRNNCVAEKLYNLIECYCSDCDRDRIGLDDLSFFLVVNEALSKLLTFIKRILGLCCRIPNATSS